MAAKKPKISVVIPVYNDDKYIGTCLEAVFSQTVRPFDVIVVDNNCTDNSISIARRYNKVKIIKEPKQGMSFARNAGLNNAKGDYLIRIDADTYLQSDHIERLINIIEQSPGYAGITGYGVSRYEFIPKISIPWGFGYYLFVKAYLGYPVLWGANMAIKKEYWYKLKKHLINDDNLVHEDQDLSLALLSVGGKILITNQLVASVQMESMLHYSKYRQYGLMLKNLKYLDKKLPRYNLKKRLPKINIFKRALFYALTVWAVYGYYLITFVYTAWWNLKKFILAH